MKNKFLVLAFLFTVLLSSSISGMVKFERSNLRRGEIYRMELNQSNLALSHNYFSVNRRLQYVEIVMQRITEASTPLRLEGAYAYFRIAPVGMTDRELDNAELEFKVSEKWLRDNNYEESRISLKRYEHNWTKLTTYPAGSISGEVYFRSNTDKFGYFAIGADPEVVIEEPEEEFIETFGEKVRLAPEKKTWKDWFRKIPKYVYFTLLGFVILAVTLVVVFSTMNKIRHPYPDLTLYVKNSLIKGRELGEIRKILIKAGWPRNIVDKELSTFPRRTIPEHMVAKEPSKVSEK